MVIYTFSAALHLFAMPWESLHLPGGMIHQIINGVTSCSRLLTGLGNRDRYLEGLIALSLQDSGALSTLVGYGGGF